MMKEINKYDNNRDWHGHNEWLDIESDMLWMRGVYKHGLPLGYHEVNTEIGGIGHDGTQVEFYIR